MRRDAGAAPQVMAMQRAAPSVPIQQQTASSSSAAAVQAPAGESALVHELLAENSRLADEVQALRTQLLGSSAAAALPQLQPVQAHPQPLQANPLHTQQQVGDAVTGVGIRYEPPAAQQLHHLIVVLAATLRQKPPRRASSTCAAGIAGSGCAHTGTPSLCAARSATRSTTAAWHP